jgi:hypothetical protein
VDDLAQFTAACHDRAVRTGADHKHHLAAVGTTQRVLFHLGILDELPRSGGPVQLTERLFDVRPGIRAQMVAYLERKKATCQAKTVTAMATRLKTMAGGWLPPGSIAPVSLEGFMWSGPGMAPVAPIGARVVTLRDFPVQAPLQVTLTDDQLIESPWV